MDAQTVYQKAIKFAALKHTEQGQTIPGTTIPYVVHLSNVAMEVLIASQHTSDFDIIFGIQVALLHDTLEDTATTVEELTAEFSSEVANGVLALTKNSDLPKASRMSDSLARIKKMPKEVWAVKLADRITNLQMPPHHWDNAKKQAYKQEAAIILETLRHGNSYLATRLADKIAEYGKYTED